MAVHAHTISGQYSSFKDLQGQRILEQALNGSAQRPCPIGRLVALLQQQLFRRGRQLQGNLPVGKQLLYILQQQAHDALQMLFPERVKGHDLVDAVDELRPERSTQCFRRFSARQLRIFVRQFEDRSRPNVAGHHQHGVPEVHGAALAVGETPILQNLQQYIEYLRVGFLNFVKQNNRVRMTADLLGELPALLVSNVARGRADERSEERRVGKEC